MLSSQSSPSPVFSSLCVLSVSAFSSLSRLCIGKSSAPRFSQTRPPYSPSSRSFCGSSPNLQTFQHANLPTFSRRLFSPKLFRIRISKNYAHNSRRMRSFKTQDLKPFRICIYKKTPRGEGRARWGLLPLASHYAPPTAHYSLFLNGNKLGSAGGVSAMASNSGYCTRSGSGTFTLERFKMLISWRALTTPLPW
jgi:hypothetical protein